MHSVGAYYPEAGMGSIPQVLVEQAAAVGVKLTFGASVSKIKVNHGQATGVELADGQFVSADAVVSDCGGLSTYLLLVDSGISSGVRRQFEEMPLQSPGVSAYLKIKGAPAPPYLKFFLPGGDSLCRVLVQPSLFAESRRESEWCAARLIAPMRHDEAGRIGREGQAAFLDQIMNEPWWRSYVAEAQLVEDRVPTKWGREFSLFRDSMNPVMTAKFMRAGRMRHRSSNVKGLFLAGSSTHPGQWVSFCTISGVLCAKQVLQV
jgi:phytoene dehydrogenase-like protein